MTTGEPCQPASCEWSHAVVTAACQEVAAADEKPADASADASERVSVAGTLLETSRLISDLLRYLAPEVAARSERLTALVLEIAEAMELDQRWEFEVAARLSQVGCLTLDSGTMEAARRGDALSDDADRAFASHPLIGRDLLAGVHRLDAVREMIARQNEPFTVSGHPAGSRTARDRMALGGQLLRIAVDLDALTGRGVPFAAAVETLRSRRDEYNGDALAALIASRDRPVA